VLSSFGWEQVAWHFDARDETRTFAVSYTMRDYVVAYEDVADLYLQVWGDQWPVGVGRLDVEILLPGDVRPLEHDLLRVWGHPASVRGRVALDPPRRITLQATDVPAEQFVEVEATFPRRLLTTTANAQVKDGDGLPTIVANEKGIYDPRYGASPAPEAASPRESIGRWLLDHLVWLLFPLFLVGRLFGFGGRGSSSSGGSSGFGGSW
jgi:Predicted membrane protein (DUF2207) N-terminal domain